MSFRVGVVVFPGSNCDRDCGLAVQRVMGSEPVYLWHADEDLKDVQAVILPGGFSYGDYWRAGVIAKVSPIMSAVRKFAAQGGAVIGICNGFQILTESGLLPGALLTNSTLRFISRWQTVRVERNDSGWTTGYKPGQIVSMPLANKEGNYICDDATYAEMERDGRILFRYCAPSGATDGGSNPNGSRGNIAGIVNARGNVLGLMPHPERAIDKLMGGGDGVGVFASLRTFLERQAQPLQRVAG